jgi:hypothetical protein
VYFQFPEAVQVQPLFGKGLLILAASASGKPPFNSSKAALIRQSNEAPVCSLVWSKDEKM